MKKILLGTVFSLVCLGMPVSSFAQENESQPTAVIDEMPSEEVQENSQEITDGAEPMENEASEEKLVEDKLSDEDKAFLDSVLKLVMPEYQTGMKKPMITKDGTDYVVTFPTASKQEIRFVRIDDLDGYSQYQAELPDIPTLYSVLGDVQTTNFKNTVRFIPSLGVVSYQDASAQEVKSDKGLSFSDFVAQRGITEKADGMFDVKTDGGLKDFLFAMPPYLRFSMASVNGEGELENTRLADEVLMSLDAQKGSYETHIDGVEFESILFPVEKLNLNLKTDLEYVNKNGVYESEVDIEATDIVVVLKDKVLESKIPTYVTFETDAVGFTREEVLKVYEASKSAALDPNNMVLAGVVVDELNKAVKNLKLDIDKLAFGNENYDIVLSGNAQFFESYTDFNGTLRIRGFDFISPEPVKIDEVTCEKEKKALQELVAKSSEGTFSLDYLTQFEKQKEAVQTACIAQKNLLDDLRPFIKTAKNEKDDKGREFLVFEIKTNEDGVFVNGEKSEKLSLGDKE